jgi:hypothetical protein
MYSLRDNLSFTTITITIFFLVQTSIMKRISSAWFVVRMRNLTSEIPSEQRRMWQKGNGKWWKEFRTVVSPYFLSSESFVRFFSILNNFNYTYIRILWHDMSPMVINDLFPMHKYFALGNTILEFFVSLGCSLSNVTSPPQLVILRLWKYNFVLRTLCRMVTISRSLYTVWQLCSQTDVITIMLLTPSIWRWEGFFGESVYS